MTYLDRELDYWLRNASGIRGTRSKAHRGEKRGRGGGKGGKGGSRVVPHHGAGSYRRTKLPSRLVTLPSRYHDLISYEIASRSSSRSLSTLDSSRFAREKEKKEKEGRGEARINRSSNWQDGERYRWIIGCEIYFLVR